MFSSTRARIVFTWSLLALFFAAALPVLANTPGAGEEDLAKLVEQLNSDQFSVRQRASQTLFDQGLRSFPALEEAAQGESREVTHRAINLLRRHYQSSTGGLKDEAKKCLETLAASDHQFAANRAKIILTPPKSPSPQIRLPMPLVRRAIIAPPNFQGRRITRVRTKVTNNSKEVELEAGDTKIKINEDANGRLKVEITEKIDGRQVVKKFDARDADELKKKSADLYKLYETFGKRNVGRPVVRRNIPVPAVPQLPADQLKRRLESLDRLEKAMEKRIEDLRKQMNENGDKDDIQRMIDTMQRSKDRFDEMKKRYQQQIEKS